MYTDLLHLNRTVLKNKVLYPATLNATKNKEKMVKEEDNECREYGNIVPRKMSTVIR